MINYQQRSKNWLEQAEYDLKSAEDVLKNKNFSLACFLSEQSTQKSLKGFLISKKQIYSQIHAITGLLEQSSKFNSEFNKFIDEGKILDKYYLSTRYPDTLPEPLLPYKAYSEKEAEEAIAISRKIFSLVERLASEKPEQ